MSHFEKNDSLIGYYMDDKKRAALFDDRFLLLVLLVTLCAFAVLVVWVRP